MILKGLLACIIGAGLLYLGYSNASYNFKLMTQGEYTVGQVRSYDVLRSSGDNKYGAIAKFELAGDTFLTTPENYLPYRPYRVRDMVEVVYLPDDPKQSKLSDDVSIGTSTFLPAGVGIVAMILGFCMMTGRVERVEDID